jgi:excisionase family DNA binding protein
MSIVGHESREADRIARRVVELLTNRGRLDEPFYTTQTLAAKLALSERSVREMLARGIIPSYKVEGARRIDPADVAVYLSRCREDRAA